MTSQSKIRWIVATLLGLGPGCAKPGIIKELIEEDLYGRINGTDWKYRHAYVDPTIDSPEADDLVIVFLPYVPKTPCPKPDEAPPRDKRALMVSAPPETKKITKLKRGTARTAVFHYDKKGEQFASVAKEGRVKIQSVTAREVKGRLHGHLNNSNWVAGSFVAIVCEYAEMK